MTAHQAPDHVFWAIEGVNRNASFEYSPTIAKKFSPNAAILLGWFFEQLLAKANPNPRTDEVEATIERICDGTGMNRKKVLNARTRLHGVLKARTKRLEHRTFYSIDVDKFKQVIGGAQ